MGIFGPEHRMFKSPTMRDTSYLTSLTPSQRRADSAGGRSRSLYYNPRVYGVGTTGLHMRQPEQLSLPLVVLPPPDSTSRPPMSLLARIRLAWQMRGRGF